MNAKGLVVVGIADMNFLCEVPPYCCYHAGDMLAVVNGEGVETLCEVKSDAISTFDNALGLLDALYGKNGRLKAIALLRRKGLEYPKGGEEE